jgi:hypothetical protein
VNDEEAVRLVDEAIQRRDDLARLVEQQTGEALPQWVGQDFSKSYAGPQDSSPRKPTGQVASATQAVPDKAPIVTASSSPERRDPIDDEPDVKLFGFRG